jgi:aminoglycoside phosphotransferase (APT) family kinase protein
VIPESRAAAEFARVLASALGVSEGDIIDPVRVVGGVSHHTWMFEMPGRPVRERVLRGEPPGTGWPTTLGREVEALRAAAAAGVPVPALLEAGTHPELGSFIVVARVPGDVSPRRVSRRYAGGPRAARLTRQLGATLARIHAIDASACPGLLEYDALDRVRAAVESLPIASPAFEFALRRLTQDRPRQRPPVVVHGDFRLGNLVVDENGLAAVLDWEAVHLGDPMEDVGWLCMRAWRFGGRPPVGGLGELAELAEGYESASAAGASLPLAELPWWMTLATMRWGADCLQLAQRHLDGTESSLELAVIGRRFYETEYDAMRLVARLD